MGESLQQLERALEWTINIVASDKSEMECIHERDNLLREASLHGTPYSDSAYRASKDLPKLLKIHYVAQVITPKGRQVMD